LCWFASYVRAKGLEGWLTLIEGKVGVPGRR